MGRRESVEDEEQASEEWSPILLTMQQAAALAQVSVDRVREWMAEPGFPVIRSTRQVRIHLKLYEEWLAQRAMQARP